MGVFMIRTALLTILMAFAASPALAAAPSPAELAFRARARAYVAGELEAGRHGQLGLQALDTLMARAHRELRAQGFGGDAEELEGEWVAHRPAFAAAAAGALGDMGDHDPASAWVATWYARVEARLGVTLCEFLHLRDVFVINFGWPVVTDPHADSTWCAETLAADPADDCGREYARHAAGTKWQREPDPQADRVEHWGLFPVAAYWVAFGACEGALWGSDGTFLCGPAATAVEIGTARYIAPPVAARIWTRNNKGG
jgi:hypothetical protein